MQTQYPIEKVIEIASQDTVFFGHTFFPRAIRQDSPEFHHEICQRLEDPRKDKKAIKVFRGGAKTTLARVIMAKRISYAISRTMLVVSETAEHSINTVKWLKHAVERQDLWAQTFGLRRGDEYVDEATKEKYSWRDDMIQIAHTKFQDENGRPLIITVIGTGIFGQTRGLNIEDFRPDFILLDDVVDEDNAKTPEQRRKVNERIYGAIANTLAPRSEAPNSCMLFLQTPLHREDAIEMARHDPEWDYMEYSCFDEHGNSRWPARWTTEELLQKKQGFINRNQLGLWLREMEVRITDDALAYFKSEWLKANYWDEYSLPALDQMTIYVGVDPTPPPKETGQNSSAALSDLDDAVIVVYGVHKGHVYILDFYQTKSPVPDELIMRMIHTWRQYRARKLGLETVLFARTIKYYLEQKMVQERTFINIEPIEDRRKKSDRIRQELTDLAFSGRLHSHPKFTTFNDQFMTYPDVAHDDCLDALAIGLMCRDQSDIIEGEYYEVPDDLPALPDWRGCP